VVLPFHYSQNRLYFCREAGFFWVLWQPSKNTMS
jgi:hypothetical protein